MAGTMDAPAAKPCQNCIALELRVAALEAELAKARKNSANSSKPPSSDIVKPPRPGSPKDKALRKRENRKREELRHQNFVAYRVIGHVVNRAGK